MQVIVLVSIAMIEREARGTKSLELRSDLVQIALQRPELLPRGWLHGVLDCSARL